MKTQYDALALARELHQEMIDRRRDFHMYPEIGFDVERTADVVAKELESYGLIVKTGVGRTGVVADLVVPEAKKTIALRADMDALPMEQISDAPYKSRIPMRAHVCGHDAHTAMLLGAAKILASLKDSLDVNVRFIFQPSEEQFPGGAPEMIRDGVLEGVDEIYAMHVWPTLQVGHYGVCVGPTLAQPDAFEITITGRGGHAAAPHLAIDPIVIAAQVIQSLQTIVARQVDPVDSAVVSVTMIQGGTAFNVIPDSVTLAGTVRTLEKATQQAVRQRLEDIVEGTALVFGGKATVNYSHGYPPLYNHEEQAHHAKNAALALVGADRSDFPAQKMMGGEDFAYYTQQAKSCYIFLGCRNEEKGFTRMVHDPRFDLDEECLVYGAAMHVELVLSS